MHSPRTERTASTARTTTPNLPAGTKLLVTGGVWRGSTAVVITPPSHGGAPCVWCEITPPVPTDGTAIGAAKSCKGYIYTQHCSPLSQQLSVF